MFLNRFIKWLFGISADEKAEREKRAGDLNQQLQRLDSAVRRHEKIQKEDSIFIRMAKLGIRDAGDAAEAVHETARKNQERLMKLADDALDIAREQRGKKPHENGTS